MIKFVMYEGAFRYMDLYQDGHLNKYFCRKDGPWSQINKYFCRKDGSWSQIKVFDYSVSSFNQSCPSKSEMIIFNAKQKYQGDII